METRKFYINSQRPLVIRNKINKWKVLKYKKSDWCKLFENKTLCFRQGDKIYRQSPYWEQLCSSKDMTLNEFFKLSIQKQGNWHYFDYKYVKDILPEKTKLFNEIKWSDLELFDVSEQDSTLWIGNEGAHTPCHVDTYGCNFVAQIFGRKLWVLIPPEETDNLNPVRVPYEESSIYSSYNFYTPNNNLLKVKKAYKIILSPGEVLFVPKHWWHYVENLEVAISINIWVPLEDDHESRLEESLVRHYISNICKDLPEKEAKQLLNPNEYSLFAKPCSFNLIQICIGNMEALRQEKKLENEKVKPTDELTQIDHLDTQFYIKEKSQVFNYNPSMNETCLDESNNRVLFAKRLINSYCHPRNVAAIKEALLNQFLSNCETKPQISLVLDPEPMKSLASTENREVEKSAQSRGARKQRRQAEEEEIEGGKYEIKKKRKMRLKK